MNLEPLISVIVPIYNTEKYLRECVESILKQSYKNIEIILVDDGSTDSSSQICDDYASQDSRIKVIHQPNGGLGKAYNNGFSAATGEYIGIVESDDFIEPDMYEKLLVPAQNYDVDIVKCDFYNYNSFKKSPDTARNIIKNVAPENKSFTISENPGLLSIHSSIWAALYKASFIKQIKFSETKSASYQDFPFMMEALMRANKIAVLHDHLLHYRQEPGNMSSISRTDDRLMLFAEQIHNSYEKLKELPCFPLVQNQFFYSGLRTCYFFYKRIDPKFKKCFFDKIVSVFNPVREINNFSFSGYLPAEKDFLKTVLADDFKASVVNIATEGQYHSYNKLLAQFLKYNLLSIFSFGKKHKEYKQKKKELKQKLKQIRRIIKGSK